MPGSERTLADPAIDRIMVVDAVPPFRLALGPVRDKLEVIPAAPLLAEAIRRLHQHKSLTDLLVF
jgi:ribose-phosphate pyrophosphokinase